MSDEEKIKNFGDVVAAVQTLTKPIEEENIRLHQQIDKINKDRHYERIAHTVAHIVIGVAFFAFILLAYLTPVEVEQGQQLPDGTQNQSYSEGFTSGK